MGVLRDLRMYARFAWGFPAFLRYRITPEEARIQLRRRLDEREDNFLRVVEKGIFSHPPSPYLKLLKRAGCTFSDLRASVRSHGLEAALRRLREAGVYVAYDEFKGRTPIVRGDLVIPARRGDFDNPFLAAAYQRTSGGTTGPGTRVMIDLDNLRFRCATQTLEDDALGTRDWPMGLWRPGLPGTGLNRTMGRIGAGQAPKRWFTPVSDRDLRPSLQFRLATEYVLGMSRLVGPALPRPEVVSRDDARVVAAWVGATVRSHGGCTLNAPVSLLVRLSAAARQDGIDLTGALFTGGGEPPTATKVAEISSCGAKFVPTYSMTEFGRIGAGCTRPAETNDLHFREDHLAVIQQPQALRGTSLEVDTFHFTTLLPSAPRLGLNVESDDYGVEEERECGCPWFEMGLHRHLRGIRSSRKLTAEGMALIATDMLRILDEVLPARFGGSTTDYQIREDEVEGGLTRLSLIVSPRVQLDDEKAVIETILEVLQRDPATDLASATWRLARTMRVRREEPVWTNRGKLMPLHLSERARSGRPAK